MKTIDDILKREIQKEYGYNKRLHDFYGENYITKHDVLTNVAKEYASQFEKEWIPATNPPKEGGRYWCYCEVLGDLGIGHFQWNCSYDVQEDSWRDNHEGYNVTHWTELLPPPNK